MCSGFVEGSVDQEDDDDDCTLQSFLIKKKIKLVENIFESDVVEDGVTVDVVDAGVADVVRKAKTVVVANDGLKKTVTRVLRKSPRIRDKDNVLLDGADEEIMIKFVKSSERGKKKEADDFEIKEKKERGKKKEGDDVEMKAKKHSKVVVNKKKLLLKKTKF
ncbi:hypothetical protein M5689_020624 [Euphorbia peplus]|nr:hypothetical protein M5689_020624 [Euphorbia peplus]